MKTTLKEKKLRCQARPTSRGDARVVTDIELIPTVVKIKSILVPTDFSPPSEKALKYALKFAEQFGATVTLLHVIEQVVVPELGMVPLVATNELTDAAKNRLERWAKEEGLQIETKTAVEVGQPFYQITETARDLKVDLIIIATHGYSGLKHIFLGSTAERVARHAPCPVLIVRDKEREFV